MKTNRQQRLRDGLIALGYAPAVKSSHQRWQVFTHFGHRTVALLHDRGRVMLWQRQFKFFQTVTFEQGREIIRAGLRARLGESR
jgi:hypothetical protein